MRSFVALCFRTAALADPYDEYEPTRWTERRDVIVLEYLDAVEARGPDRV